MIDHVRELGCPRQKLILRDYSVGHRRFLARDRIYAIARYMPMPSSVRLSVCCLSVCPSVRHTGGSVEDGWS